jgi:hypothetical protein
MNLDSLTPLSRSLFSLLGVKQCVLLQASRVRGGQANTGPPPGQAPGLVFDFISVYQGVVAYQVSENSCMVPQGSRTCVLCCIHAVCQCAK